MTHSIPSLRAVLAAVAVLSATPALADASFLDRFEGRFAGKGFVQREQDTSPRSVSCAVNGTRPSPNALTIAGSCRAAIIVTRKIGADIRFDRATNRFAGTYTGSSRGPAQLSNGRLNGNTLTLDLTYPTPVHGDRRAVMRITNAGGGQLTLAVTDQVDGAAKKTSDITLSKG